MKPSITDFSKKVERIASTNSRTTKKAVIREVVSDEPWHKQIELISGQRFDDLGIQTTTAKKVISQAYGKPVTEVEEDLSEYGTPAEVVKQYGNAGGHVDDLDLLYSDLVDLYDMRGDKQKGELARMLQTYKCPWLVMWAAVGRMTIGVTHNTIANAVGGAEGYSKDEIKQGRALITDSVEFVSRVKEGDVLTEPKVGTPFKVMKANANPPDNEEGWVAQPKIDGYRAVLHVDDGDVEAFTTGLEDRSDILPELDKIDWPSGEWIFDSEVVASDNSYTKTSERMQRKAGSRLPHTMNFWVFDVIVADGEDVSDEPFEDRIDTMFESLPQSEYLVPVHAFDDISIAVEEAKEMGYEGLVVKTKDHTFQFGQRSGDWQKVKLDEHTADLKVTGFKEGTGENAGTLGAIKVETGDGVEMGSVGTGFSDKLRDEIWENRTEWLGEIVELEFSVEDNYDEGLRFPRYLRRRDDKLEANTHEYLESLK